MRPSLTVEAYPPVGKILLSGEQETEDWLALKYLKVINQEILNNATWKESLPSAAGVHDPEPELTSGETTARSLHITSGLDSVFTMVVYTVTAS